MLKRIFQCYPAGMLRELSVRHFALIEDLRLSFSPGLTVISGETGAGKSILVTALYLLTGDRADSTFVRQGEKEARIEAVFELPPGHPVLSSLTATGIEANGEVIIRRIVSAEGKSRVFVNDSSLTLVQLKKITASLIDMIGQHDQQGLLNEENHRLFVDGFPETASALESYRAIYFETAALRQKRNTLLAAEKERARQTEFLKDQLKEIEDAALTDPMEEENLVAERARSRHAGELHALAEETSAWVEGEEGLRALSRLLQKVEKNAVNDPALEEAIKMMSEAKVNLEEVSRFFEGYRRRLDVRPGRLEEIEARLFLFQKLRRKYGASLAEVLEYQDECRAKLNTFENLEESLKEVEKQIALKEKESIRYARALSDARSKKAASLSKEIEKNVKTLAMPHACIRLAVETPKNVGFEVLNEFGADTIRFVFAPNPGEGEKELSRIASGGELSRVMLAIKLSDKAAGSTSIFDEVDSGVGGAAAEVIGKTLKNLGSRQQVLCITHLPQVAAFGNAHIRMEKEVEKNRTKTSARRLSEKESVDELARMMAGSEVTPAAIRHAEELRQRGRTD